MLIRIRKYLLKYIPIYISVLLIVLCPLQAFAVDGGFDEITFDLAEVWTINGVNDYRKLNYYTSPSAPYYLSSTTWTYYDSYGAEYTDSVYFAGGTSNINVQIEFTLEDAVAATESQSNTLHFKCHFKDNSYVQQSRKSSYIRRLNSQGTIIDGYSATYSQIDGFYTWEFNCPISEEGVATEYYILEFNLRAPSTVSEFVLYFEDVVITAGDPNDFPSYTLPDTSLIEQEDAMTEGANNKFKEKWDSFNDSVFQSTLLDPNNNGIIRGFVVISRFFDILSQMNGVDLLLRYSVLFGIATFILGLGVSAISHFRGGDP